MLVSGILFSVAIAFVVNKRKRTRSPSVDTDENDGSSRTTTVAHHPSGETQTSQNISTGTDTHAIELLPNHELWVSSNDHGTMSHIQTPFGAGSHIEPDITNMSAIKVGTSRYTPTDNINISGVKVDISRCTPTDTTSARIDGTGMHIQSENTNIPGSISGTRMPAIESRNTLERSKGRSPCDLFSPSSVASFQQSSQFPSKRSAQVVKEAECDPHLTKEDHLLQSRETSTDMLLHHLKSSG